MLCTDALTAPLKFLAVPYKFCTEDPHCVHRSDSSVCIHVYKRKSVSDRTKINRSFCHLNGAVLQYQTQPSYRGVAAM